MKDFKAACQQPITKDQWREFLKHNFNSKDRKAAYELVKNRIDRYYIGAPLKLLEIGFGQCHDFKNCFQKYCDEKQIVYKGLDITPQFVGYAREDFVGYDFNVGGFEAIDGEYDITFTAKTLEHQPPHKYEEYLKNMLNSTSKTAIIIWFKKPGNEKMHWGARDGFNHEGAWENTYCAKKIKQIIDDCGFVLNDVIDCDGTRSVYAMDRRK